MLIVVSTRIRTSATSMRGVKLTSTNSGGSLGGSSTHTSGRRSLGEEAGLTSSPVRPPQAASTHPRPLSASARAASRTIGYTDFESRRRRLPFAVRDSGQTRMSNAGFYADTSRSRRVWPALGIHRHAIDQWLKASPGTCRLKAICGTGACIGTHADRGVEAHQETFRRLNGAVARIDAPHVSVVDRKWSGGGCTTAGREKEDNWEASFHVK